MSERAGGDSPEPHPRRIDPHRITTHPVRRAILAIFDADRDLEASAVDLLHNPGVEGIGVENLELSKMGYHCTVLEGADLLGETRREPVRGAVKRIFTLTHQGRAFLDGQAGLLGANVVLDRMAAIVASVEGPDEKLDAYNKLAGLIEETGRDVGAE